jgi:hypothetical protein
MMEFDKTVNAAEIMNGVALCEEAQRIVLTACPGAEAQRALLKILKNYDAPKDQVREALLWTKNGDIAVANKRPKFSDPPYDAKYAEWKKKDIERQVELALEHNAKVVQEHDSIMPLSEALLAAAKVPEGPQVVPAVVAHFLYQHPVPMVKDGVFLVESKDGKQRSWYLMPATTKIPFLKRVAIFFKLVFGSY